MDTWLRYLPEVYPVAIQLQAASRTDADAALAWKDRFLSHGLRLGYELILVPPQIRGIAPDLDRGGSTADAYERRIFLW